MINICICGHTYDRHDKESRAFYARCLDCLDIYMTDMDFDGCIPHDARHNPAHEFKADNIRYLEDLNNKKENNS